MSEWPAIWRFTGSDSIIFCDLSPTPYMDEVGASNRLISDFAINTKSRFISVSLGNGLAV